MSKSKSFNILAVFSILLLVLTYIYYEKTRDVAVENAQTKIDELLLNYKAFRTYVGKVQKQEVYRLQEKKTISCDYFKPQLLSSTYSAKTVNDFYNHYRESQNKQPIKIRFASDNPRNLNNKATPKESEILSQFNSGKIDRFVEIRETENGKTLYYAVPTKRTTPECMRCHSDPKLAPKGLIEIYGDKNGFYEKEGNIRALLSTEYPLTEDFEYANNIFTKITLITFLIFTILFLLVRRYNTKLSRKNKELEQLNETLDKKVALRTKELDYERRYIKSILDSNSNIIIVTDGSSIKSANKQFFDFFG